MQIIPVIDIKENQAVYAIQGKRSEYRPVNTPLCQSSDPFAVIDSFLHIADFRSVYVADLNSIMGQGNNRRLITELLRSYPDINFWIDNGSFRDLERTPSLANYVPIVGSEALRETDLDALTDCCSQWILSLDFSMEKKLGPEQLFSNEQYWPADVIIMTLARVGTLTGPDFQKLAFFYQNYPDKNFIAAGGIRHYDDLSKLKKSGIRQALIAGALHTKQIGRLEILNLSLEQR